MKAVVVGAGSWGTTFAGLLEERGHDVVVAGRRAPFVPVAEAPIEEADLVCLAVPSRVFKEVAEALPGHAPRLILTKGLDPASGRRLSEVVGDAPVAVLSGPNHAEEISLGQVASAVHTSTFYFCKLFKRVTGINFTEYVSRLRTEKAKALLLNPNLRVSEIASKGLSITCR